MDSDAAFEMAVLPHAIEMEEVFKVRRDGLEQWGCATAERLGGVEGPALRP